MKKQKKNNIFLLFGCAILYLNSCHSINEQLDPIHASDGTQIPVSLISPIVGPHNRDKEYPVNHFQINKNNMTAAVEMERIVEHPKDYKLEDGIHYKVIVYKKINDKYTFQESKDFITGNKNEIYLAKNEKYTIITYSLGTNSVIPDLINQEDFANAKINADYVHEKAKELLYQRIDDFIPDGYHNLPIKLESKMTNIKLVIDVSDFYGANVSGEVTSLVDYAVTYKKYEKATLNISSNKVFYEGEDMVISNEFKFDSEPHKKIAVLKNILLNDSEEITFTAKLEVNGMEDHQPYIINIKNIELGSNQVINLKLEGCGIIINGVWRQFMCYNLGADIGTEEYRTNPFYPNKKLHGDRYQWADALHISMKEDQEESNPNVENDWIDMNRETIVLDHTWGSDNRNPCPLGYRIPDKYELEELSKNKFTKKESSDPYFEGFELKNRENGRLFFPAAGRRSIIGKVWDTRGKMTGIWSGNQANMGAAYFLFIGLEDGDKSKTFVNQEPKYHGYQVRCIKKLESEL